MVVFIIALPLLLIVLRVIFKNIHEHNAGRLMSVSIKCNLHDDDYGYEFVYYENNGQIKEAGGDGYLINITDADRYEDAYQALDKIDAYVKNNGGTCTKSEAKVVLDN
jgi:hypothetical protein